MTHAGWDGRKTSTLEVGGVVVLRIDRLLAQLLRRILLVDVDQCVVQLVQRTLRGRQAVHPDEQHPVGVLLVARLARVLVLDCCGI